MHSAVPHDGDRFDLRDEIRDARFGNRKLNARAAKVLAQIDQDTRKTSINSTFAGWADTQAAYRFLSNEKTSSEILIDAHRQQILEPCELFDQERHHEALGTIPFDVPTREKILREKGKNTGCRIEQLRLKTASAIQVCTALYAIIAWRLNFLVEHARLHGEEPCDRYFSDEEWESTLVIAKKAKHPVRPPGLGEFMRVVAGLVCKIQHSVPGFYEWSV